LAADDLLEEGIRMGITSMRGYKRSAYLLSIISVMKIKYSQGKTRH
jgi:hypothetical protein